MPLLSVNLSIDRLIAQIEINWVSAKKPMHNRAMVATIVFLYSHWHTGFLTVCSVLQALKAYPVKGVILGSFKFMAMNKA